MFTFGFVTSLNLFFICIRLCSQKESIVFAHVGDTMNLACVCGYVGVLDLPYLKQSNVSLEGLHEVKEIDIYADDVMFFSSQLEKFSDMKN
jgi:hypothetical protein